MPEPTLRRDDPDEIKRQGTPSGAWSPTTTSDIEQHPLFHRKEDIVNLLLAHYQARNHYTDTESLGSSSQSSTENSQAGRKRPASTGSADEEQDGRDSMVPRNNKRQKTYSGESTNRLSFACPYSKRYPVIFSHCCTKKLRRIGDVKQHLRRRHVSRSLCTHCRAVFDAAEDTGVVTTQTAQHDCSSCQAPQVILNGITQEKQDRIFRKHHGRMSHEEQWYLIFDILFPGEARPASPYHDPELLETAQSLVNFVERHGRSIVADHFEQRTSTDYERILLQQLLVAILPEIIQAWMREQQNALQRQPDSVVQASASSLAQGTVGSSSAEPDIALWQVGSVAEQTEYFSSGGSTNPPGWDEATSSMAQQTDQSTGITYEQNTERQHEDRVHDGRVESEIDHNLNIFSSEEDVQEADFFHNFPGAHCQYMNGYGGSHFPSWN